MDALALNPVGAAIQGGLGLAQSGYGLYQKIKGDKMMRDAQNNRPTYQIPEEMKQKLSSAQLMALEGLPAAQKEQYINNIQRSANFGLTALADRKSGIAGVSTLVQNQNDAYGDLLSKDAGARMQNMKDLGGVQSEMAGYEDKAFEVNQFNPYLQKYQTGQAMQGSGVQNIWGGLGTASGGLLSAFGRDKEPKPATLQGVMEQDVRPTASAATTGEQPIVSENPSIGGGLQNLGGLRMFDSMDNGDAPMLSKSKFSRYSYPSY